MKSFRSILCTLFITTACSGLFGDQVSRQSNDNAILYDTEWSTDDEVEGLKFYKDNSVMYFSGKFRGKGSFEYDAANQYISFEGLEVYFTSFTAVEDHARILEDGSMKLFWHAMGESKGYYEILYKRR